MKADTDVTFILVVLASAWSTGDRDMTCERDVVEMIFMFSVWSEVS